MSHANETSQRDRLLPWPIELETEAVRCAAWQGDPTMPQAESISMASVWQLDSPAAADAALDGQSDAFVYRRVAHPNARALATKLATLHGGHSAVLTAQGMSAISAVAWSVLRPGSVVWIGQELYGETTKLFTRDLVRWGISTRLFDPCDSRQIEQLAASAVDLVFIETLTNPRLRTPPIAQIADAARRAGSLLAVDNTFATHLLCRPLELGADYVVESLGKQVNGHSDGMLGMVSSRDAQQMRALAETVKTCGMASSPLDCYVTHRGLMSLAVRMQRACENALALAQALEALSGVECVDYPGLASHASHAVAAVQMQGGYGWMLSFRVNLNREGVARLFDALRPEICFAPSLGDVNTTVSHPLSTSHRGLAQEALQRAGVLEKHGIFEGTIRVSCGIEPTKWLVERFTHAIETVLVGGQ